MSIAFVLTTLLLTATLPVDAVAKDVSISKPAAAQTFASSQHDEERGTFSSAERNLIRSWLLEKERREAARQPAAELPPGLQKKVARGKPLPPGWQKKLARGEHLDLDYYRQGMGLPDELLRRLPPPPPGSEILQIEDRFIRLDAATRTILDVFGLGGQ
jgi:Ni/Co efflux regulator RcnB